MQSLPPISEEGGSDDESFVDHDEQFTRRSERQDESHRHRTDPSSPPPPVPLYTPFPALAVSNFLTDDDGASLIEQGDGEEVPEEAIAVETLPSAPTSSGSTPRLTQRRSRSSSASTITVAHSTSRIARMSSLFSVDSVAEHFTARAGEKSFRLADFCKLIDAHPSLERAKIMSVECYTEPIQFGIVHRTLIFHLRRERRTDIWMRVDRQRSRKVLFPVFVLRGGRTEANDVALLGGSKESLLARRPATRENSIEFRTPPHLGVFRFCLHVICEELLEYRLWPNCWFMCSLLQEHLYNTGKGAFQYGGYRYLNLARDIRSRIEARVYHTVQLPTSEDETKSRRPEASQDLLWRYKRRGSKWVASTAFMEQLRREVEATGTVASQNDTPNASSEAASGIDLALYAFLSEDKLYQSEIFAKPSRLLSAAQAHRSRAIWVRAQLRRLQDTAKRLRATPLHLHRYNLVSKLVCAAKATSETYPATSCACLKHACAILEGSPKIGRLWIDSQVLKGHANDVNCVAFSPDGKQIVSASDDKTIHRWDALTGESIGEPMRGHREWVRAVAFSPDGTQIVSGSNDQTLQRWDASSGESIGASMQGHTKTVLSVAYSPDGRFIVSGSFDCTIRRWDAHTGEAVGAPLEGHTGWVRSVAFSPDGKRIASGSDDQTIRIWDAIAGEAIGEAWKGHNARVSSVAFSPDGRFVVSGSWDHTVRRWNALTGESIGEPMTGHTGFVYCVTVSPDGSQIASGSYDETIRIWDATTGGPIGVPLKGHTREVNSVAFSPDGRQIASSSSDQTVRLWDSLEGLDRWTNSE